MGGTTVVAGEDGRESAGSGAGGLGLIKDKRGTARVR